MSDNIPTVSVGLKIGNAQYKLTAHKVDSSGAIISSRELTDWFDNLIVDNGMNYLATSTNAPCSYACIGSGNTPPANGDTGLANFIAQTSTKSTASTFTNNTTVAPYYMECTFTYRFAAAGVARNISEVGLQTGAALANQNGNLFSRALVRDSGGTPITISVAAGEILDVTYRYRIYPPAADITGVQTWTIAGVPSNLNYTARAVSLGGTYWQMDFSSQGNFKPQYDAGTTSGFRGFAKTGALDSVTGNGVTTGGGGNYFQWTNGFTDAYIPGSFQLDCTFEIAAGSGTGINYKTFCTMFGLGINSGLCYQCELSAPVTKNASQRLRFRVRFSWARM